MSELDIQKQKTKNRRNNIIVIALAVVLVAVVVLYFLQNREHTAILTELRSEKDAIEMELTDIMASYDSLKTENDTINTQLMYAQTRVKDLLLEVEQTKRISLEEISEYQAEVTSLRGIMRNFIVQIDSLNQRNEELLAENREVKEQYVQVEAEKQQLSIANEQLERQVERASMLGVRDLIAEPQNVRSQPTRYARRTDKVRIYFVLTENVTARRGTKNIYARIMRPDQLLLIKSDDNLFQFEDLRIPYSAMREVVYEGQDLPVAIFWDNSDEPELMEGEYTVDLFADGRNIATTTFTLR